MPVAGPVSRTEGEKCLMLSIVSFEDIFIQMFMCVSEDPSYSLGGRPGQKEDSCPSQQQLKKEIQGLFFLFQPQIHKYTYSLVVCNANNGHHFN